MRAMAGDLELPTACGSAALVIYHAYRSRRPAGSPPPKCKVEMDWWRIEASACILVAAKVNEVPRKVRDVVNVAHQRTWPRTEPLEVGATFWDIRDAVVASEQDVLRALGFSIQPPLPFNYLLNYLKALDATAMLSATSFSILNESFDLPLCIYFEPHEIAAACIYIASTLLNIPLPSRQDDAGQEISWNDVVAVTAPRLEELGSLIMGHVEALASIHKAPGDPRNGRGGMDGREGGMGIWG